MDSVSGVGVLDKTIAILDAVGGGAESLGAIVVATGISRATAHRLAQGMEAHGLLWRHTSGYRLGPRLLGLGRLASAALPLAELAGPVLQALRDDTGESTQLYVIDGDHRRCVAAVESNAELRTMVSVGARLTMERGSAAKILAAGDASPAWVASVAERAPGVASVSAPVRVGELVIAAISVSGPVERLGDDPGQRFGAMVAAAGERLAAAFPDPTTGPSGDPSAGSLAGPA